MNHETVYRTAPATPDLLKMKWGGVSIFLGTHTSGHGDSMTESADAVKKVVKNKKKFFGRKKIIWVLKDFWKLLHYCHYCRYCHYCHYHHYYHIGV